MSSKKDIKSILFATIVLSVLVLHANKNVEADVATDLSNKIQSHTSEIDKLEAEIAQYQTQLNNTSKDALSLKGSINELDISKKKLQAEISVTENKISSTELRIQSLNLDIGDKSKTIDVNQLAIARNIAKINELDANPLIISMLSNDRIADVWNEIESLKRIQSDVYNHTKDVIAVRHGLEGDRNEELEAKKELLALKDELNGQKKVLDINIKDKNKLLSETKNLESNYKKILADKLALKAAFEKELQSYESQLKYVLDPSSIPARGSHPLGWPLTNVFITQMFGKTVDSVRLYTSGTHSGTDFRASIGTPVLAMASGVVVASGDTDATCRGASFGKWVFIKYDNGLASTYGHLSLVSAAKGARVSPGQIVAYSGNTGHSTAPHLHVSLYPADAVDVSGKESIACKGKILVQPRAATNAYLNPLDYMPSYTSSMIKS